MRKPVLFFHHRRFFMMGVVIFTGWSKDDGAFPTVGLGSGQGITGMSTIGYREYVRYSVK